MARYGREYGFRTGGGEPGFRRNFHSSPVPYGRSARYDTGMGGYGGQDYSMDYSTEAFARDERWHPSAWRGSGRAGYGNDFADREQAVWGVRRPTQWPEGTPHGGERTGEPWGTAGSPAEQVRVSEIMTANPEAVTPDTLLSEVARRMRELDVGVMPVVEDESSYRLSGLITDRDITIRAVAEQTDLQTARVSDFMTPNVETVTETDHVRDVFTVMKRDLVRRVPVVDGEQRLVGIVSQADLAVNYAGLNLPRETEVEEVIERISEPARPRWGGRQYEGPVRQGIRYSTRGFQEQDGPARGRGQASHSRRPDYDQSFGEVLREGWDTLQQGVRELRGRGRRPDWR